MPKRMIRDWTDSIKLDGISAEAERMFIRLIMKADDFGRFHAEPRLVRGYCFPLLENLRTEHVGRWLDELSHRNLIFRYEAESQKLLAVINFGQRLNQARPKFPAPPGEKQDWLPSSEYFREVPGSSGNLPPEEEEEEEVEKKKKLKARARQVDDVLAFVAELQLPPSDGEWFWNKCEGNGWRNGNSKISDWKATIRAWRAAGYMPSQKDGAHRPRSKQETLL